MSVLVLCSGMRIDVALVAALRTQGVRVVLAQDESAAVPSVGALGVLVPQVSADALGVLEFWRSLDQLTNGPLPARHVGPVKLRKIEISQVPKLGRTGKRQREQRTRCHK